MNGKRSATLVILATFLGLLALTSWGPAEQKQPPIKIGIVSSLFRDLADAKIQTMIPEFQALMREQTGLDGEVVTAGDTFDLGKRLNDKAVQLGVFHGIEFAWAQQAYPELQPLLIAVNRHGNLKAFVAVLNENKANSLADLKGKILSIPSRCPEHCHVFLDHELRAMGVTAKDFFAKIVQHSNAEDALDDILRDKVQAVLVDGEALENYDQVKPGCYARLKMVAKAEGFPPGVVAIRKGGLDNGTVAKLEKGMLTASTTVGGKEQLALWKLTRFEKLPADFPAMEKDIAKRFPPAKTKS
jgi:ABC-type phosphate/phosphonate transport system substrate-binding protein